MALILNNGKLIIENIDSDFEVAIVVQTPRGNDIIEYINQGQAKLIIQHLKEQFEL